MKYGLLLFWIQLGFTVLAQEPRPNPAAQMQQLLVAAYEREAIIKNSVQEARQQIRAQFHSREDMQVFDSLFSRMLGSNSQEYTFPARLHTAIETVMDQGAFLQMIDDLRKLKLQNYTFENYQLARQTGSGCQLIPDSQSSQQIAFFELQAGDRVGELGAGSGWMSFLLGTLYDSVEIRINEISTELIARIEQEMAHKLTSRQQARFSTVLGTEQSTGMEGESLDVIIAIDVFHHFSDPAGMLEAIKRSLATDGRLCLVEQVNEANFPKAYCPEALEKTELEASMQENGFVKIREQQLASATSGHTVMFEYRMK